MQPKRSSDAWNRAVLVLGGVLAIMGCAGGKSESKSEKPRASKSESREASLSAKSTRQGDVKPVARDLSKEKPDFTLTAKDFAADYKKDKKAAAVKYRGKVTELSGLIVGFGRNIEGTHFLELEGQDSLDNVLCLTTMTNPWLKASPGQTVKIRGLWPPSPFTATLMDCQIIEVSGEPCPNLTADQLAKIHDANPKKYRGAKGIILEGVVASVKTDGATTVEMRHSGKCKIRCTFPGIPKFDATRVPVGKRIRVIGQENSSDKSTFSLIFCVLIEE